MNWLDVSIIIIAVLALISGYRSGFILQLTGLIGLVLGLLFMGEVAHEIIPYIVSILSVNPTTASIISYILGFAIIILVVYAFGKIIDIFFELPILNSINKILGALFSSVKWLLVFSILLFFLTRIDTDKKYITAKVRSESRFYNDLLAFPSFIVEKFKK